MLLPGISFGTLLRKVLEAIVVGVVAALIVKLIVETGASFLLLAITLVIAYIVIASVIESYSRRRLPVEAVYANQEAALDEIEMSLRDCESEIRILVSRGSSLFVPDPTPTRFREELQRIAAPVVIKILMLSPESLKHVEERAKESGEPRELYRQEIARSIKYIHTHCGAMKNLKLKLYDQKVIWRLFIIDDLLFLGSYPKGKHGEEACILKIRRGSNEASSRMYDAFVRSFEWIWNESRDYTELSSAWQNHAKAATGGL